MGTSTPFIDVGTGFVWLPSGSLPNSMIHVGRGGEWMSHGALELGEVTVNTPRMPACALPENYLAMSRSLPDIRRESTACCE